MSSSSPTGTTSCVSSLIVTAPSELRHELVGLDVSRLVARCARFRPGDLATPTGAAKYSLRLLARRHGQLTPEIEGVNNELLRLTAETAMTQPRTIWPVV